MADRDFTKRTHSNLNPCPFPSSRPGIWRPRKKLRNEPKVEIRRQKVTPATNRDAYDYRSCKEITKRSHRSARGSKFRVQSSKFPKMRNEANSIRNSFFT